MPANTVPHPTAEFLRVAIEAVPTGMLMVDRGGRIALVNTQIERIFGYRREELMNESVEMLVPLRFRGAHASHRSGFFRAPDTRPMGQARDLYGLRKDGSEVPVEIGLNPLQLADGDFVLSSVADITERQRAEREKEDLLNQLATMNADLEDRVRQRTGELIGALSKRDILLREVHHRVKNNLQVVSSLLNLQARKLNEGATVDAIQAAQTRVQAIALIHEQLHQPNDHGRVPFSDYVRSLAASIFLAAGVTPSTVSLDLLLDDVMLGANKAIPCGLVLNELVTNALRHGFPDGRSGTIRIEVTKLDDGRLRLAVRDNGVGSSRGFDLRRLDSLGLELVSTIAEQLDAVFEVNHSGGTSVQFTFHVDA